MLISDKLNYFFTADIANYLLTRTLIKTENHLFGLRLNLNNRFTVSYTLVAAKISTEKI